MLIEVKETHPPGAGKKVATVIAADGRKYEIWPEKLTGIQVGARYEADVAEREYMGRTIYSIKKVTPVNGASQSSPSPSTGGGASGEGEYVGHVVSALILKGEIVDKQIPAFTARLRRIWRETDPGQQYQEAAE